MTLVLIVDDSAVMRGWLSESFAHATDLEVQTAIDPLFALAKMQKRWPDVIVLDLEMPRMDGMTFLKKVMAERPTPVVVCSTLTEKGAEASVKALAAGAVGVFPKLKLRSPDGKQALQQALLAAVREAAQSRFTTAPGGPEPVRAPSPAAIAGVELIALGASTGGTVALEQVLVQLPEDVPGIVIVQHMPEKFTLAFAQRLDSLARVRVTEAQGGEVIRPGIALVAPGGKHLSVVADGDRLVARVLEAPPVNRHRPSVDVLFNSAAKVAGPRTLAMLMTGMGDDGARGLLALRQAGARTVAQDEASCVVFGMPKQAIAIGAAQQTLPLSQLSGVISACRATKRAA